MNAMEIMDPKMDPNCEGKRVRREICSFQQLFEVSASSLFISYNQLNTANGYLL